MELQNATDHGHHKPRCHVASVCMGATAPLLPRQSGAARSSQATVPCCFGLHGCYGAFATKAERGSAVIASHGATVCMVLLCLCCQSGTRRCGRRKPRCFGASVCMGATAPLLPRRNEAVRSSQATASQAVLCEGRRKEKGGAFQRKVTLPIPTFAKRLKYSRLE